ncbi:MAG: SAM-dependent methyltransferase [Verrucomicrobia bacterium]|nr:SAM-dependent methyltransferase [Verrucomicrobiota bacterium]
MPAPLDTFLDLLRAALAEGTLVKVTLGKPRGTDPTLRNIYVRPVALKAGPRLAFVWRHATRDITKNFPHDEALAQLTALIGGEFLHASLGTATATAQLEFDDDGSAKLHQSRAVAAAPRPVDAHDHAKAYAIPADAPWLRALGVTNDRGQPREGMAGKFRQIQKFAELLSHLVTEAFPDAAAPLRVTDAGSGKGYLTFALAALLGPRATVRGIEQRPELVELCNRLAREHGLANLSFAAGAIAAAAIENRESKIENPNVLIALHACDTATDDALAQGIAAGAQLLVVSPCCQKELRAQLAAPAVLADALRHGIFQERQAEFVTDALRAQLLEWAGYRTKVFEFISTEHTAKNLMIAAIKTHAPGDPARAARLRDFAAFYGIRTQRLAEHLHLSLTA